VLNRGAALEKIARQHQQAASVINLSGRQMRTGNTFLPGRAEKQFSSAWIKNKDDVASTQSDCWTPPALSILKIAPGPVND
jgi:hypothetical protein